MAENRPQTFGASVVYELQLRRKSYVIAIFSTWQILALAIENENYGLHSMAL